MLPVFVVIVSSWFSGGLTALTRLSPQTHRSPANPLRRLSSPSMPTAVADVLAEADRLLEPARFEDYCVNGLQVRGPREARRIATGVSAHAELFERAAAREADLLLVHHGLFWGAGVRV